MRPVLSAPGNLLVAGEYAVLEEGGLGLAVAIEPLVTLWARAAGELLVTGVLGDGSTVWTPHARGQGGLIDTVVAAVCGDRDLPALEIRVDSSLFFRGAKLGYGSSAAVCAALTAALLWGTTGDRPTAEVVLPRALEGHRAFQGGGSGYDVAASVHGGTGLFRGGRQPVWEPLSVSWLADARVFRGTNPVRTPGATARYRAWREREPAQARAFLARSNALVEALSRARSPEAARETLEECARAGVELGERIGVSAVLRPPPAVTPDGWLWKALGAGNEVGLLLPRAPGAPAPVDTLPLVVSAGGIRWS